MLSGKTPTFCPRRRRLPESLLPTAGACIFFCLAAPAIRARPGGEAPRPLGEAERQGVVLALEYLQNGPPAWLDDLAASCPWRGKEGAAREIELRAGPAAGARWRLATAADRSSAQFHIEYPSGLEEVLRLRLVENDGTWRIADILAGWEAPPEKVPEKPPAYDPQPDEQMAATQAPVDHGESYSALLAVAGLGLLLLARHTPEKPGRIAFAAAGFVVLAIALWPWLEGLRGRDAAAPVAGAPAPARPAVAGSEETLAWRRRLAGGLEKAGPAPAGSPPEVKLWAAEAAYAANRFDQSAALAAAAGAGAAGSPTALRLRGRLAARRSDDGDVLRACEALARAWPYDEVLLVEASEALLGFGFEARAGDLLDQLRRLEPRWPEAQRLFALQSLLEELPLSGAGSLEWALRLGPSRRRDLISDPLGAGLVAASSPLRASLGLGRAQPPPVECPPADAVALPVLPDLPAIRVERVGLSLYYRVGAAELEVPGGCALAAPATPVLSAEAWLDRREKALADQAAGLAAELAGDGSDPPPARRRRLAETLEALLAAGRYPEILRLSENLGETVLAELPSTARRARALALLREGRRPEAFALLTALIGSDVETRRNDPALLFDLADIMTVERHYESAQRLYLAADRRLPFPASLQRRTQLKLEKKMLERSLVVERPPFKIYYSPFRGPRYVAAIADYLEAERKRLGAFIPLRAAPRPIEVLLIDPDDFQRSYGGKKVELLGLYDGKVRVPLGRIRVLSQFTAAILTHELAHALIADASSDRAPHWFQEGLAQLVEPDRKDINPVAALQSRDGWLAFPLVEAALSGMATAELASQGYEESLWSAIFLQDRHGRKVFGQLAEAWRRGAGEEEALAAATGLTLEELDRQLVEWGRVERVPFYSTDKAPLPD